jgi:hypothetical protein
MPYSQAVRIAAWDREERLVERSSIGAGAAISLGKKIRALTATRDNPKIKTTINGAMY